MVDGHVLMKFVGKIFKSKKQYQDGKWHYLTARKQGTRYENFNSCIFTFLHLMVEYNSVVIESVESTQYRLLYHYYYSIICIALSKLE